MNKKRITLLDFLTALNIPNHTFPSRKDCMIKQRTNVHKFFEIIPARLEPVAFFHRWTALLRVLKVFTEQQFISVTFIHNSCNVTESLALLKNVK